MSLSTGLTKSVCLGAATRVVYRFWSVPLKDVAESVPVFTKPPGFCTGFGRGTRCQPTSTPSPSCRTRSPISQNERPCSSTQATAAAGVGSSLSWGTASATGIAASSEPPPG
eukprot:scaffold8345_cov60-Phaeocystis_antarctica.AAC.3